MVKFSLSPVDTAIAGVSVCPLTQNTPVGRVNPAYHVAGMLNNVSCSVVIVDRCGHHVHTTVGVLTLVWTSCTHSTVDMRCNDVR